MAAKTRYMVNSSSKYFSAIRLFLILIATPFVLRSQCDNPPNGESCLCTTAPILCTPDELDGATFSMSDAVNYGGFGQGNDLCPGIQNQDGVPNNVNWFAFIAWCTDLTINVNISNCSPGTQGFGPPSYGVQVGLFAGCPIDDPLECFTEGNDICSNNPTGFTTQRVFAVNGLTVGNTYYFMLDGCKGSACDIELDVIGTCGTGEIDDWTTGLTGEQNACVGENYTYTAEDLDGAVEFYYYIDGTLVDDGTEQTTFNHVWTTEGTYQLCVDVSNLPCIPESDMPDQNCITVTVYDPGAGDLAIQPQPVCPGEEVTVTVTGYNMNPDLDLVLFIVDENNIIQQVVMGDNTTVIHTECATWTAYALNYIVADGPAIQSVGDIFATIDCGDGCCDVIDEDITWEDTEDPVFASNPASETVDCADDITAAEMLNYTDNCLPDGSVAPTIIENFTLCDGGTILRTWTIVDSCENEATHDQTITVNPIPLAVFQNPPAATETVTCENKPTTFPDLVLTNMGTSTCLIQETIMPAIVDNTTICGGDIVATWSYTDLCNRPYEYIQTITVDPPPAPTMSPMPANIDLQCGDMIPPPEQVTVTNGAAAGCLLEEVITATIEDNTGLCDGTMVYTWTYSDACGNMLEHSQTITIIPPDEPSFTTTPGPVTVMCTEIPTTTESLTVDNGMMGPCQIMDSVAPTVTDDTDECGGTITYDWTYTDVCDRTIVWQQVITVDPAPEGDFENVPMDMTIDCGDPAGNPINLTFTNSSSGACLIQETVIPTVSGMEDPCGGDIVYTWSFTDDCDRTKSVSQTITVNPAPEAAFVSPPGEVTVPCASFNAAPTTLSYTNGETGSCEIEGTVTGTLSGTPGPCGVPVSFMWQDTDDCDRPITHMQVVNIEEADLPTFDMMPANITIDCDAVPATPPNLTYSNGSTGSCERSGSIAAIQSGSYDACGGTLIYTWSTMDVCGYPLSLSQTVQVLPASPPMWITPPFDEQLGCDETVPSPPDLMYDNGASTNCRVMGSVPATVTQDGLETTFTWTYTTPCNPSVTITHTQVITESSIPEAVIDPTEATICEGDFFDLTSINAIDNNGGIITVQFLDESGNILTAPNVGPAVTTNYIVRIINDAGCTDEVPFELIVEQRPIAGLGVFDTRCVGASPISLFDFLTGNYSTNGTWIDVDGIGLNINDPTFVNISGLEPGEYQFDYVVPGSDVCPEQSASIFLSMQEAPTAEIFEVVCDDTGGTYSVTLLVPNGDVSPSAGIVTAFPGNIVTISEIPLSETVEIFIEDFGTQCSFNFSISPPDCDCPTVPAPMAVPTSAICAGSSNPQLSVTVQAGLSANWYTAANGGMLLQANSLTYLPTMPSAPGIYSYYVESIDAEGCLSNSRVLVRFEIIAPPIVNAANLARCPDNQGIVNFNLSQLNSQVNGNTNFTYKYYATLVNADTDNDEILPAMISTSTDTTLYVRVTTGQGCSATGPVSLTVYESPTFSTAVMGEQCAGDDNGSVTILGLSPINATTTLNGTIQPDTGSVPPAFSNLAPGQYILAVTTSSSCLARDTLLVEEGPMLQTADLTIVCNKAGTDIDPSDDFYVIRFRVVQAAGTTITVLDGNNNSLPVVTDLPFYEVQLPADGSAGQTITVTDNDSGCSTSFNTGPLTPCSTDCSFTLAPLVPICNGSGTPTDPADDFYTLAINATAVNGTSAIYNVLVNNVLASSFAYGVGGSITIPATGTTATVTIIDLDDSQCFLTEVIGPLTSCSNQCIMAIEDLDVDCDGNETAGVDTDDTSTISFLISETNAASDSANILIDGQLVQTVSYGNTPVVLNLPADGTSHTFTIQDSEDEDCNTEFTEVLTPCSGECMLSLSSTEPECFNNGTADTELDDTFTAMLTITHVDGSGQWLINETGDTGMSGATVEVGPFAIADGDVILTVVDASIASCIDSITLVAPAPCSSCEGEVEAGANELLTCDIEEVTLTGSSSPSGLVSFWTNPAGQITNATTIEASSTGVYYFSTDYGDNCIITDSLTITTDDSVPTALAGPNQIFDCDTDSLVLMGAVTGGTGPFSYEWKNANGVVVGTTSEITIYAPGIFTLRVTDISTGCNSPSDAIEILDKIAGPQAVIYTDPGSILDCVIEVIYLSSEEESDVTYNWTINGVAAAGAGLNITDTAQVMLVAIDTLTGCSNTDSINITSLEEYPIINIQPFQPLDCAVTEITLDASQSQSGTTITYTWSDEEGIIIATDVDNILVSEEGTYILTLVDSNNGCENADTIIVQNIGDFPTISAETLVEVDCDVQEVDLTVNLDSQLSDVTILWTATGGNIVTGQGTANITVDGAGIYEVSVVNNINNCESTASIEVTYPEPIAEVDIVTLAENCEDNNDGSATANVLAGGTPPFMYFLDEELVDENAFSNLSAGTYLLTVVDANQCVFDTSFTIDVLPAFMVSLPPDITVQDGQSTTLTVTTDLPDSQIASILWSPAAGLDCDTCTTVTFTGTVAQSYTVTVTDINGCEAEAEIRVDLTPVIDIYFPNVFNPVGSSNNSFYLITNDPEAIIDKIAIFDRWGNKMYEERSVRPNDPDLGWKGQIGDRDVEQGVYVYYGEVIMGNGDRVTLSGDVTVIR